MRTFFGGLCRTATFAKSTYRQLFCFMASVFLVVVSPVLQARVINDAFVIAVDGGYAIEIELNAPMRLVSVTPQDISSEFEVQLNPRDFGRQEGIQGIADQLPLSWNKKSKAPIRELTYEGSESNFPRLILRFTQAVRIDVTNGSDFRSVKILVEVPQTAETVTPSVSSGDLLSSVTPTSEDEAELLTAARNAMLVQEYSRAVQYFTKLTRSSSPEVVRRAREMIGVARELNGQLAHAKREYQDFLVAYPEGEDSDRVKQRLATLLTAARQPAGGAATGDGAEDSAWETDYYGSFAQRYSRDDLSLDQGGSAVLRNQLTNDLDFVIRTQKEGFEVKTQFVGSYIQDFENSADSEFRPNIASLQVRSRDGGYEATLGRQNRTTGGVLGRYDGVHAAYNLTEDIVVNAVAGDPVLITQRDIINTDQTFYGVSVDVAEFLWGTDFTGYYITQDNSGVTDREAVGMELRYFDANKSFFTLVDYDIYFDELNTFLFIGSWNVRDESKLNLTLDYRNSPVLTKANAIQGQGVTSLDALFDVYTDDELKQLALDRTAVSETLTGGWVEQFGEDWQLIGEVTGTKFGDTPASGGVEAMPATDWEFYYNTQLIGNSVFYDEDTMILGVRYGDATSNNTYTLTANWRRDVTKDFRINPLLRIDHRTDKNSNDSRWVYRPYIRLEYYVRRWFKLESEFGYERYEEDTAAGKVSSDTTFVMVGFRAMF